MYCGDETGAFVGDVSSYSSCFGYGGEDCPKSVFPSYMYNDGTIPTSLHRLPSSLANSNSSSAQSAVTSATNAQNFEQKLQSPTSSTSPSITSKTSNSFQKENDLIPIYSPYPTGNDALNPDSYLENDGVIQNYNAYENVWMKAFHDLNVRHLGKHYHGYGNGTVGGNNGGNNGGRVKIRRLHQVSSSNIKEQNKDHYDDSLDVNNQVLIHPLLAIDSGHTAFNSNNSGKNSEAAIAIKNKQRCKIMEILFESLSAPAAFVAPSPMLSSFAFGRQTSLIVDVGARGMRVTPIVDGLLLENAQRRSGRGGEWLNSIQNHVLNEHLDQKRKRRKKKNTQQDTTTYVHPRYACQMGKDGNGDSSGNRVTVNYAYTNIQQSIFHNFAVRDVMYQMKTSPHITGVDLYRNDNWTVPFLHMSTSTSESAKRQSTSSVQKVANDNNNNNDDNNNDNDKESDQGTKIEPMDIDDSEQGQTKSSESKDQHDNDHFNATDTDSDSDDDSQEDYDTKCKKRYTLPDGTKINLQKTQTGKDLCRLAELFFAQELPFSNTFATTSTTTNTDGATSTSASASTSTSSFQQQPTFSSLPIHELIKESLTAVADADVRKELCGNIILTGASSLFPNIEQRLSLETSYLVPNMYRCKIICSRNTLERRYSPWIGGSVLTSLGSFQQLWLSKAEYDEYGAMLGTQRFP